MENLVARSQPLVARPFDAPPQHSQYLTFSLAGGTYAIGILHVREIIEYGQITEVPMMPPFVRGVINLRGAVVPVIDLGARFGGACTAVQRRSCIVIVEIDGDNGRQELGIIVDAVLEVLEIPAAAVEPPPTFGARLRVDFIAGIGEVDGKFVILLDIARVLATDELAALSACAGDGELPA